jgi:transcription initiation factor TFIID TATA-box-binding protein
MTTVKIENIVGTGNLNIEVDIPVLANDLEAHEVTYNPDNYHGLYVRLDESGPLVTVYRTGKYIVTGADSETELFDTKDRFLSLLHETGVLDHSEDDSFGVNNIVCTGDIGYSVDLNQLSIALGLERIEYEPEQFPGLVYRPEDHPCVILLFGSGKCVVTGAPTLDTAEAAFNHIRNRVDEVLNP